MAGRRGGEVGSRPPWRRVSVRHMGLVLDHFDGRSHLKLTLLILADHANADGECWPSYDTIAARLCTSRRTAINNVGELIAHGYVEVIEKGGRFRDWKGRPFYATNVFRVSEKRLSQLPRLQEKSCPQSPVDEDAALHGRGEAHFTRLRTAGVKHTSPKPSGRTISNNHKGDSPVDNLESEDPETIREQIAESLRMASGGGR